MGMANLTIRNLDAATKKALRVRAAQHGVSMEEEARRILKSAICGAQYPAMLGSRLLDRFGKLADDGFVVPERHTPRTPAWNEPE